MIQALSQIFLFWLLGESLQYLGGLPISGNVLGMLLLFGWLTFRAEVAKELRETAQRLIGLLSLLLLPGGVGLFFLSEAMQGQWLAVLTAVIGGTLISVALTLVLMRWLLNREAEDS